MKPGFYPLLTAFFLTAGQAWPAAQLKTSAGETGAPVLPGGSVSAGQTQLSQPRGAAPAPGLLPSLQAPVGSPDVAGAKALVPQALPTLSYTAAPARLAPQTLAPPALPASLVPVSAPATTRTGQTASAAERQQPPSPAPGEATGKADAEGPAAAPQAARARARPGPDLIERAKATAAQLSAGQRTEVEDPDRQAAGRYIRGIMGSREPTAAETAALLQDFMEMKGIRPDSERGRALRQAFAPAQASSARAADPAAGVSASPARTALRAFFQERSRAGGSGPPEAGLRDFLARRGIAPDSAQGRAISEQAALSFKVLRRLGLKRQKGAGLDDIDQELARGVLAGEVVEGTFYRGMSVEELAAWQAAKGMPPAASYKFVGMDPRTVLGQYAGKDLPGTVLVRIRGKAVPYGPGAAEKEALLIQADSFSPVR